MAGTWKAEKTFDELGVKAFENANAAGLEPVAYFDDVSDINKTELDAACPTPWLTLAGWAILAFANFIPHLVELGWFQVQFTLPGLIGALCCLSIGAILVWPIREAYNDRDLKSMILFQKFLSGFGFIFLGCVSTANAFQGPFWLAFMGGKQIQMSRHRTCCDRKVLTSALLPSIQPFSSSRHHTVSGKPERWESRGCATEGQIGTMLFAVEEDLFM